MHASRIVVTASVRLAALVALLPLLSTFVCGVARGQDLGSVSSRMTNLDLPIGSALSEGLDDEERPPDVVVFYGTTFETDGVYFCLDRSMSMGGDEWVLLQHELVRVVTELSDTSEFGIVFFDSEAYSFPEGGRPAPATADAKAAALTYLSSMTPSSRSTCFLEGLRVVMRMAHRSDLARRSVIFMSDGKATCVGEDTATYMERTFAEVGALNTDGVPVHTIGVGLEVVEYFLQTLAARNHGTYRRLSN